MNKPFLTVIIPTFNRSTCLEICLKQLFSQNLSKNSYEIIVVNDGSYDETESILKKFESEENFRHFHQKNSGQGNARNLAINNSQGQIILFIGDDIYCEENFLKKHIDFHIENPENNYACLGRIEWFPENKITPFMYWLTNGGPQFAFNNLVDSKEATFWYFYTSNISIKTDLLKNENFDPDFKSYGWEDIELAYRLKNKFNLKIIYKQNILAYHDHQISEDSLKKRMISIGKSAKIFEKKAVDVKVVPRGMKLLILTLISSNISLLFLWIFKSILPILFRKYYWYALSKRYFLIGLKNV